jgi:hypothetical protein
MTPKRKRFSSAWTRYEVARVPTSTLTHELVVSFVDMLGDDYRSDVSVLVDQLVIARSSTAAKFSQTPR